MSERTDSNDTERFPLRIILEWLNEQPEIVNSYLTKEVLMRTKKVTSLELMSGISLESWLSDRLDYFQHVGRVLTTRAVFDFVFTRQCNENFWRNSQEFHLSIVDSGDFPKGLRSMTNQVLGGIPDSKEMWAKALRSWEGIRDAHLTDFQLHHWENIMQRQFAGLNPWEGDDESETL